MLTDSAKNPNLPWQFRAQDMRCSHVEEQYPIWVRSNRLRASDTRRMREDLSGFGHKPLVSILLQIREPERTRLGWTLDSVLAQLYPDWEVYICGGDSAVEHAREMLSCYERLDARIRAILPKRNAGASATPNSVLCVTAGEFVGILDQGDELAPDALFEVVKLLQEHPEADLIYSDSDKTDEAGNRGAPHFKPDWSPDLLLSTNYVSRPGFYRRSILEEIGGFREAFEPCQDYDLTLRFTEKTDEICHVPKVLYHSRVTTASTASSDDDRPREASFRALSEALKRRGIEGSVEAGSFSGCFRVKRKIMGEPKVSVIIPTRDNAALLRNCVESLERLTTYSNYEILIVDNDSADPETVEYLASTSHRVLRFEEEFNYSKINNFGVSYAEGEYVLLLNDDMEIISGGWMEAMLEHAQREEIGAVGAKLLYPNNLIQHAGIVLGTGNFWASGVAAHSCQHYSANSSGYVGTMINTTRNYEAVTAACMMLRQAVFEEIGGFDQEELSVAFNDVDLCLRIRELGYRIVYTPHAALYHYESSSRGFQRRSEENLYMRKRWGKALDSDPYYNPNFSLGTGDFNLRADMLRPRILRTNYEDLTEGESRKHLEEMSKQDRRSYLEAERKKIRNSRRTAIVARKATGLITKEFFESGWSAKSTDPHRDPQVIQTSSKTEEPLGTASVNETPEK